MTQKALFELPEATPGQVEDQLRRRDVDTVVGVDEAGRGPLAGPVVAAAFFVDLRADHLSELEGLDDSKKVETEDREALYEKLIDFDALYATASRGPAVIDEVNILQATFQAMTEAIEEVVDALESPPDAVLIDGHLTIPHGRWNQRAVVKGDARSHAIAAASILAKVRRDRFMRRIDEDWPEYGFAGHKGYPTQQHRSALEEYGACPIHRRSFSGVPGGD